MHAPGSTHSTYIEQHAARPGWNDDVIAARMPHLHFHLDLSTEVACQPCSICNTADRASLRLSFFLVSYPQAMPISIVQSVMHGCLLETELKSEASVALIRCF